MPGGYPAPGKERVPAKVILGLRPHPHHPMAEKDPDALENREPEVASWPRAYVAAVLMWRPCLCGGRAYVAVGCAWQPASLLLEEVLECVIDLIGVRPGDRVRAAFDREQLHVRDEPGQTPACVRERQDPVSVALDYEHRNVDPRQVGTEVGFPRRDAGDCRDGGRCRRDVPACPVRLVAHQRAAENVHVVEVVQKALHPGGL